MVLSGRIQAKADSNEIEGEISYLQSRPQVDGVASEGMDVLSHGVFRKWLGDTWPDCRYKGPGAIGTLA